MAHLDSLLDDALLGFDDDEADAPAAPAAAPAPAPPAQQTATTGPKEPAAAAAQPGGTAAPDAAASGGSAAAAAGTRAAGGSLQFDPLKRKKKPGKAGAGAAAPAAAAAARDALGSSSSSTGSGGSRRPALTPQVHQLQEDLAKLMADWSQALHPEADGMSGQEQQQQQQRASSSVLQALAAQTQRTVDEQARLQPPLPGSLASASAAASAAAAAAGAARPGAGGAGEGGEQQQVNAIVDVVMQHLLSKDVLYQPMKEIKDKYPPWLERHAAQGAASSLPAGDLQRYQQQYAIICTLVQAYDSEPDNTAKIMDLLQQMQACGEPPAEIVEEMSSAIAADLPGLAGAGAAGAGSGLPDLDFDNLDIGDLGLENLPAELKNCPVQ